MNFKKSTLLFFLSIITFYLSAQDKIIYNKTIKNNFEFSYSKNFKNNNNISSFFLHEIAKYIPNSFTTPKYVFSNKINSKITKTSKNKYSVEIKFNDKKCSGNVFYKDFDISKILENTIADFSLKIYSDDKKFCLKKQIKNFNTDSILNFNFADSMADNHFNVNFIIKKISYNKLSKNIFNEKIKIINSYYFSIDLIKSTNSKLHNISLEDHNNYPFILIKIDEIQQLLNFVKKNNFQDVLNIKNFDPENFINKLNNLNIANNQLKNNFTSSVNSLKFIFFKKDLNSLANSYITSVKNQQKVLNPDNNDDLIIKLYNKEYFLSFGKNFNRIFSKFYNPNNNLLSEFENKIYEQLLQSTNILINKNNDVEASNNLIFLRSFCKHTKGKYNIDIIESNISKAKYGMYHSYLNIVNKALKMDNLNMSEKYISYAENYQKNNNDYIFSDDYIKKYYSLLADKYIEFANKKFDKRNYFKSKTLLDKAIKINEIRDISNDSYSRINNFTVKYNTQIYNSTLDSAEKFISKNDLLKAEKTIKNAIKFKQKKSDKIYSKRAVLLLSKIKYGNYIYLVNKAEKAYNYENYDSAFKILVKAQDFSNKYLFHNIDKRFNDLFKNSNKKIILKNLKKGNIKAWGNELKEADIILNNALEMQTKYQLSADLEINKAIKYLESKIILKRCQNIDSEYYNYCLKAKESIENKNFINAEKYLKSAILCISNDNVCNLVDNYASKTLLEYESVIQYQKSVNILKNDIIDNKFNKFLSNFYDVENFYENNNINRYNITHLSIEDYILLYKNLEFTEFCLNNFINKKDYNNALDLLIELYKNESNINNYKYFQIKLAKLFARRDFKVNKNLDSETNIKKYTDNNNWFSYFNKQYKLSILKKKFKSIF